MLKVDLHLYLQRTCFKQVYWYKDLQNFMLMYFPMYVDGIVATCVLKDIFYINNSVIILFLVNF